MKMYKKMADIAKEAGVSKTTVSRLLRDKGYVAEDTKKRILKIIKKYDYSVDSVAQSLRMMKTNTLGFVMSQIYPDPFQSVISMFLEKQAKKNNYRLLISNTLGNAEEEKYAVNLFMQYRVDGVIFGYLIDPKVTGLLKSKGIPFVLLERRRKLANVNAVLLNYYKGIEISINHLISKGAKKIGFIGPGLGDEVENEIFESYKNTLKINGINFEEDLVYLGWMDVKTGYDGIKKFVDNKNVPDACIIINDITTLGAMRAITEAKIKIPEDMMIISSDNTLSGFLPVPVSSITFKKEVMADTAFNLIIENIKNKNIKKEVIVLEPDLIKRESSRF
jgi:LacI family transcriptional regulator